jgi:hypothetical protein
MVDVVPFAGEKPHKTSHQARQDEYKCYELDLAMDERWTVLQSEGKQLYKHNQVSLCFSFSH